ncbi:hypothetical protein HPT25_03815 [Bacillus sp. BRMEA1]|uniref:hypothetical protein n=1 Tax=Neobacillus endophyticus TaxID=2738405 RepID=UPI001565EC02|nr:hypothetical protein [Neobacillus endophyticus]NRD76617.1 hypothetical protein [Neobacillus endophyticus]
MRLSCYIASILCISIFILSGFENKEPVKVSIVSTSITKQGLGYDIKLKFIHCNERCKENLHLKIKPGLDLKSLMESNDRELLLQNESKYIKGDIGKYYLEYRTKKNEPTNKIVFFSKNATLLVMDGLKVIQKVPLKQFREKTLPY